MIMIRFESLFMMFPRQGSLMDWIKSQIDGDVRDYWGKYFHFLSMLFSLREHEFWQFFNLRIVIKTLRGIPSDLRRTRWMKREEKSYKIYHKFRYNELWRLSAQKFSTNIKIPWLITFGFIFIVIGDLTFLQWEKPSSARLKVKALRILIFMKNEKMDDNVFHFFLHR